MTEDMTQQLLATRRAALHHLEIQQAEQGIHTPYHIVAGIAQHRKEIERLMTYSYIYTLQREVLQAEQPPPMPGLVALVSPEQIDAYQPRLRQSAFDAMQYHRPALRCCWLIATSGAHGSLDAANWLVDYCQHWNIAAEVWHVADPSSVDETFQLTRWLYTVAIPAAGLQPAEVIADLTGAVKPMTIGMWLACAPHIPVQYMARQPDDKPSLPMLLTFPCTPSAPEAHSTSE